MNPDEMIRALTEKMEGAQGEMGAIQASMHADGRDEMTADELQKMEDLQARFDNWGKQRQAQEKAMAAHAEMRAVQPRQTVSDDDAHTDDDGAAPRMQARAPVTGNQPLAAIRGPSMAQSPQAMLRDGQRGFQTFGEFAQAVYAANTAHHLDPRLQFMANSQNTLTGSDGGHLVPPDFQEEIAERSFGDQSVIGMTDRRNSARGEIIVPRNKNAPWTGGVTAYWTGQESQATKSKEDIEPFQVKAHKLMAYVEVSEEAFEDAPALDSHLRARMPGAIDWSVAKAIFYGSGVGQPLGLMNGDGLIVQAKETSQAADSVVAANITKMLAHLPSTSRNTAAWFIHPQVEGLLPLMTLGDQPVYMPPGGLSGRQYGTLLGRPVIPHETCKAVGDQGDIVLTDLRQYMTVLKTGSGRAADGMKMSVSMHFLFDTDKMAYKLTMRVGGAPWWEDALASENGSFTTSPYVTLAARA